MSNPDGRPRSDLIRDAWCLRFDVDRNNQDSMPDALMAQLSYCKSDECRRLILGISS